MIGGLDTEKPFVRLLLPLCIALNPENHRKLQNKVFYSIQY